MDMTCVDTVLMSADPDDWQPGDSWLAGGTVLYSYGTDITRGAPRRLLDITDAGWEPLTWTPAGDLEIAGTCRIAEIFAFPLSPMARVGRIHADGGDPQHFSGADPLPGLHLIRPCCDSFVASWKIWNMSTVAGNVATALPAGPMISLLAGLDAEALLIRAGGERRTISVADLVLDEARTGLRDGELIRSFTIPRAALGQKCAFRRISLTERGRSAALLIGRLTGPGSIRLVLTASTRRPIALDLGGGARHPATADGLERAIASAMEGERTRDAFWHDDIHGAPAWRAAMTHRLGGEILDELLGGAGTTARVTGDITMTATTGRSS